MGCVHSVEEESVQRCRERRKLMKHLLSRQVELAAAHMTYLQSLRNTGATLRQFTKVDSAIPMGAATILPPSLPPPPLSPSPPLPHSFSPQLRKVEMKAEAEEDNVGEDSIDIDDEDNDYCTPRPPSLHGSAWDFWDPFGAMPSSSVSSQKKNAGSMHEASEEENWVEANTEFGEKDKAEGEPVGDAEGETIVRNPNTAFDLAAEKSPVREVVDDNSSAVSCFTKETDMAVVVWRSKKTLAGIVKELDNYFLKAAAGGKEVAVLLKSNKHNSLNWDFEETKDPLTIVPHWKAFIPRSINVGARPLPDERI